MEAKKGKVKRKRPEKKKKPSFNVPNLKFFKSVKSRWRKPRGTHNKKRMKAAFMGASPKIGYRNPEKVRGLHSSGKREVLVRNMSELEAMKEAGAVLRFAAALGTRKRKLMVERAKSLKLVVLNMKENGRAEQSK